MARITVDDCLIKVPDRYELIMLAALRARHLRFGLPPTVAPRKDQATVIALREIAAGTIDLDRLRMSLLISNNLEGRPDFPPEEDVFSWAQGVDLAKAQEILRDVHVDWS